jgi:hypothetical protein
MFTTAGVTFFTMSEKPCAIDGGTPAAVADGSPAIGLSVQASANAHTQLAKPSARPFSLHVAMTVILRKVYTSSLIDEDEQLIVHYPFRGLQRLIVPFENQLPKRTTGWNPINDLNTRKRVSPP